MAEKARRRQVARGYALDVPKENWGEIVHVICSRYSYTWFDLLKLPISVMVMHYEWAIYGENYEIYIQQLLSPKL